VESARVKGQHVNAFPSTVPDDFDAPAVIREHDWQAFSTLNHMVNHWSRPDWTEGRCSYHWLLSFRHAANVRQLAEQCQAQLDVQAFDLVPRDSLHVTLGQVGFTDEIDKATALAVANEAGPRCAELPPFHLTIGPLAGSRGALRFTVAPWTPLLTLYDQLAAATSTVLGEQAVMDSRYFRPHLSIAYAHTDVPVTSLLPVLMQLRGLPTVSIEVASAVLVELRREGRVYHHDELVRLPLAGTA
jgi:2'-5' RNA ligase